MILGHSHLPSKCKTKTRNFLSITLHSIVNRAQNAKNEFWIEMAFCTLEKSILIKYISKRQCIEKKIPYDSDRNNVLQMAKIILGKSIF